MAGYLPGETTTLPVALFFAAEAGRHGPALAYGLASVALTAAALALGRVRRDP